RGHARARGRGEGDRRQRARPGHARGGPGGFRTAGAAHAARRHQDRRVRCPGPTRPPRLRRGGGGRGAGRGEPGQRQGPALGRRRPGDRGFPPRAARRPAVSQEAPVAAERAGAGWVPDAAGHFGIYGGRFAPEALMAALSELTAEYLAAKADPRFAAELDDLLRGYAGRPTMLSQAHRFSELAHCTVLLKREDLAHTGLTKINNYLGQVLLAKGMGKGGGTAETGAGKHGVATATACALFGLDCVVYMGEADTRRQALNVARMRMLGAEVIPVTIGTATLKDAMNEAFRDWVATVAATHYC